LKIHWHAIHNSEESYEKKPNAFPNTVFIGLSNLLIKEGKANKICLDTDVVNSHTSNGTSIFEVPACYLYKGVDKIYYDLRDATAFSQYYLGRSEKQQRLVAKEILGKNIHNIDPLWRISTPGFKKLANDIQTLSLSMPLLTRTTKDNLNQRLVLVGVHFYRQNHDPIYIEANYQYLPSRHVFPWKQMPELLTSRGFINPATNTLSCSLADFLKSFKEQSSQDKTSFIDAVLSKGANKLSELFAGVASDEAFKNLAIIILDHAGTQDDTYRNNTHLEALASVMRCLGKKDNTAGYAINERYNDIVEMAFDLSWVPSQMTERAPKAKAPPASASLFGGAVADENKEPQAIDADKANQWQQAFATTLKGR